MRPPASPSLPGPSSALSSSSPSPHGPPHGSSPAERAATPSSAAAEPESWTIGRVLRWTQGRFAARGLLSPRLDAELLLAHTLGRTRVALYTHFDQLLSKDELTRFRECILRRLAGVPVAYLVGEKEFYGLSLQVNDSVLIPRPETELLVDVGVRLLPPAPLGAAEVLAEAPLPERDASLHTPSPEDAQSVARSLFHRAEPGVEMTVHYDDPEPAVAPADGATADAVSPDADLPEGADVADEAGRGSAVNAAAEDGGRQIEPSEAAQARAADAVPATVFDVGTGSGAVALAIKHLRPDVRVIAIEQSPVAIAVATENAARLGLAVEFWHGDLLAPLPAGLLADVIVANLPYIPTAEISALAAEVRHEPHSALDGGSDGLALVRRLIAQAPSRLQRGGAVALEIGAGQAAATEALLQAAGFVDVRSELDLAKIARVVHGRLL